MSDLDTRQSASITTWIAPALIHTFLVGVIVTRMAISGAGYARTYKDYGLALPSLSKASVALSQVLADSLVLVMPLILAFWCLDVVALWQLGERDRRNGWSWFWVGCGVLVLLLILVEFTLLLPMWKLHEALSR
jgi:hypothetical protein